MILYINKQNCKSVDQLIGYFKNLEVGSYTYYDLLEAGRYGDLAQWLRELKQEKLAVGVESIDSTLDDSKFVNQLAAIITGNNAVALGKKDFEQCYAFKAIKEVSSTEKQVRIDLEFQVLMSINETFTVSVETAWGKHGNTVNSYELEENKIIKLSYVFKKRPGIDIGEYLVRADDKELKETAKIRKRQSSIRLAKEESLRLEKEKEQEAKELADKKAEEKVQLQIQQILKDAEKEANARIKDIYDSAEKEAFSKSEDLIAQAKRDAQQNAEKITDQARLEAKKKTDSIVEQARKEAQTIKDLAEQDALKQVEKILSDGEQQALKTSEENVKLLEQAKFEAQQKAEGIINKAKVDAQDKAKTIVEKINTETAQEIEALKQKAEVEAKVEADKIINQAKANATQEADILIAQAKADALHNANEIVQQAQQKAQQVSESIIQEAKDYVLQNEEMIKKDAVEKARLLAEGIITTAEKDAKLTAEEIKKIAEQDALAKAQEKIRQEEEEKKKNSNREKDTQLGYKLLTINGTSFKMLYVNNGTFNMGATNRDIAAADNEKPSHSVTLDSFFIGETQVTQALWNAVMGVPVEDIAEKYGWDTPGTGPNFPMYYVSWCDCKAFIDTLNNLLSNQLDGRIFRLPTEAEWEYAACGGNKSKGFIYSGSNDPDEVAWYEENSGDVIEQKSWLGFKVEREFVNQKTHPVKQKRPNELGLYDMSGNVMEWCSDYYSVDYYKMSSNKNPQGPERGFERVIRGGDWQNGKVSCRITSRDCGNPLELGLNVGFRLVLSDKKNNL